MDLLVLPVVSALIVAIVGVAASGRSKATRSVLRDYDLPVLKFASIQVTFGMFIIYSTLFVMLVMLGFGTAISVTRYDAIVKYCLM